MYLFCATYWIVCVLVNHLSYDWLSIFRKLLKINWPRKGSWWDTIFLSQQAAKIRCDTTKYWWRWATELLFPPIGIVNWYNHFGKQFDTAQWSWVYVYSQPRIMLLLCLYWGESLACVYQALSTTRLIVAFFMITIKQIQWLSLSNRMNGLWYILSGLLFSGEDKCVTATWHQYEWISKICWAK